MLYRWLLIAVLMLAGCTDTVPTDQGFRQASRGMISAGFSEDGSLSFVGSIDHGGSLWQIASKERLYNWNHAGEQYSAFRAAVFSEDGQFVATTQGQAMALWSTSTGEAIRYWQSPSRILAVAMSKQYVMLGQDNDVAILFDTVSGGVVGGLQHDGPVSSVAIDQHAKFALTGSHDGTVRYWSLDSGEELQHWANKQPIDLVQLSPNQKIAFSAAFQGEVILRNATTGEDILQLYKRNPGVISARFNASATKLLLGTSREKIILWDLVTESVAKTWHVENDGPWDKAAIIAVGFVEGSDRYLAAASNGISYELN